MEVKKPKTFKQQMLRLKEHGIVIEDEEGCITFLEKVNYYRFSAYLLPFRKSDKSYREKASFEEAKKIYDFDRKVRAELFQVIEEIELHLRTQLAYWHSHKYGSIGYLDKNSFNEKHKHEIFEKLIQAEVDKNKNTAVIKHHVNKYDGKIPLWVAIEYFSTGMISHFYSDMKTPEKKAFAKLHYSTNVKCLESWLRCFTDLRNRCAHYSRLYFWKFSAMPTIPLEVKRIAERGLFDQLLVLKFLCPTKEKWRNSFLTELRAIMEEYKEYIELRHIGFPDNWEDMLDI